jgi:hypothetical protein
MSLPKPGAAEPATNNVRILPWHGCLAMSLGTSTIPTRTGSFSDLMELTNRYDDPLEGLVQATHAYEERPLA